MLFILLAGVLRWLLVVAVVSVFWFVAASLVSWIRAGSLAAGVRVNGRRVRQMFSDIRGVSLRRLWALTWHTMIEAVRRRVLFAFIIFGVLFLFAGWYIDTHPTEQVKVYVSFVFRATSVMMFAIAVLIGSFSLPADIQQRTIHTVVTKPVRRLEIVFGRVLGMTLISAGMILIMGVLSFVYLQRSIRGTIAQFENEAAAAERRGDTDRARRLRDDVEQLRNHMTARIPIMGRLAFYDAQGKLKETGGVNVGYENTRRGYIPGGSPENATWRFTHLPVQELLARKAIPLEVSFEVFRTTKGEIGKGVLAELRYRNPHTKYSITDYPFYIREYYTQKEGLDVNRPGLSEDRAQLEQKLNELLKDSNGELEIEVRCLSSSQYLGMAFDDLYILLDHASFSVNFLKGLTGVVLQVALVITLAVTFSSFLSGPVALVATLTSIVLGLFMDFAREIAVGAQGGGMLESLIRILLHENLQRDLEPELWVRAALFLDKFIFNKVLMALTLVLPDLGRLNLWPYVANGFNVPIWVLVFQVLATLAYALPFALAGYLTLQSREIAR